MIISTKIEVEVSRCLLFLVVYVLNFFQRCEKSPYKRLKMEKVRQMSHLFTKLPTAL